MASLARDDLFSDAVNSSVYMASDSRGNLWVIIEEGLEGSGRGLIQCTIAVLSWRV